MGKPTENLSTTHENPVETSQNLPVRKNLGGRPKKTDEEKLRLQEDKKLQNIIDTYLTGTDKINWTIAGMARALGLKNSRELIQKAKDSGGAYSYAILKMEEKGEEFLFSKCYPGAIFLLKQLGWEDTQKVETEVKAVTVNISLEASLDDLSKMLDPVVEVPAV